MTSYPQNPEDRDEQLPEHPPEEAATQRLPLRPPQPPAPEEAPTDEHQREDDQTGGNPDSLEDPAGDSAPPAGIETSTESGVARAPEVPSEGVVTRPSEPSNLPNAPYPAGPPQASHSPHEPQTPGEGHGAENSPQDPRYPQEPHQPGPGFTPPWTPSGPGPAPGSGTPSGPAQSGPVHEEPRHLPSCPSSETSRREQDQHTPYPGPGVAAPQPPYPQTAQASRSAHAPQSAQPPFPFSPSSPEGHTAEPQQPQRNKRRIGVGGFLAGVLVAGLLGGGVAVGATTLLNDSESVDTSTGIEINNPENATPVTAAAAKASPSVVTLAVSDGASAGSGSGIILDDQGHVLTNTHVVTLGGQTASPEIQVRLDDGSVTTAEVVGTDPLSDLAVIQLADAEGLQPAELASSSELNVGDQAIAIGAPLGLSGTVTDGIVSTLDRTITVASSEVPEEESDVPEDEGDEDDAEGFEFYFPEQDESAQGAIYLNVIQTDAAINQGNSGGALVDNEGRVIGVNVAIASTGGTFTEGDAGSIGVGFAIPIDYASRVADDLIENGEATHGLMGVTVGAAGVQDEGDPESLSPQAFTVGALVDDVADGSPAAEGGLQSGDLITAVEGRQIDDSLALTATVREYAAGETITISYIRNGEEHETEVTLDGM